MAALQQIRFPPFNSDNEYHISVCASINYHYLKDTLTSHTRLPHQVKLTLGVIVSYKSPKLKVQTIYGYVTRKAFVVASGEIFSDKCEETVASKIDLMEIPFPMDRNLEWKSRYRSGKGINRRRRSLTNEADMVTEMAKFVHGMRDNPPLYLEGLEINLEIEKTIMLPHQEFVALNSALEKVGFTKPLFDLIQGEPEKRLEARIRAMELLEEDRFKDVSDSNPSSMELCPVCWEKFAVGSKVVETPCSHVYHKGCLAKWLVVNMSCPYCRSSLSR